MLRKIAQFLTVATFVIRDLMRQISQIQSEMTDPMRVQDTAEHNSDALNREVINALGTDGSGLES